MKKWREDVNYYTPEETELLRKTALLIADTCHVSLPGDDILVLTTDNFPTIISIIKKIARKVGLGELGAMVLLAIAVRDTYVLKKAGYKSESDFFNKNAYLMGISASTARDFSIRGRIFLDHRLDIFNGIDDVDGISLETFANTCMSKLALYEKAVEAFGRKQALIYLKTLSFREFKKKISPDVPKEHPVKNKKHSKKSERTECDYNLLIKELDLKPNENRLLRLIVKRAKYISTGYNLTDHQVNLIQTRYREFLLKAIQKDYEDRSERWAYYKPMDPDNPLKIDHLCFFNGTVFEKIVATREDYMEELTWDFAAPEKYQHFENRIFNRHDIMLRIRAGIAQMQPARRTIAILLFRLVNEKALKNKWKKPREGVEYKSFKDFASEELGLSENYRDYLAVGKVLKEYHYFLDHLTDIDTKETFLKLKHLPAALKTHKNDEHLVLARLRSLSIREFKRFSTDPDFETTFGRRLTKEEWDTFYHRLGQTRVMHGFGDKVPASFYNTEYIEVFDVADYGIIYKIADKVIEETSLTIVPPAPIVDATDTSKQADETTDDGVNTDIDDSSQTLTA
jgi:hypothetical protein